MIRPSVSSARLSNSMQSHDSAWEPSQADIDRKPWKYTGYQSFSAFVASDNDFFVSRKFAALSARVLLGLQDQLRAWNKIWKHWKRRHGRRMHQMYTMDLSDRRLEKTDRLLCAKPSLYFGSIVSPSISLPRSDKKARYEIQIASNTPQKYIGAAYAPCLFCPYKQTLTVTF